MIYGTEVIIKDTIPGQVIKRGHPEAGHHRALPLLRQQLVPHSLLTPLRMFHLIKHTAILLKASIKATLKQYSSVMLS